MGIAEWWSSGLDFRTLDAVWPMDCEIDVWGRKADKALNVWEGESICLFSEVENSAAYDKRLGQKRAGVKPDSYQEETLLTVYEGDLGRNPLQLSYRDRLMSRWEGWRGVAKTKEWTWRPHACDGPPPDKAGGTAKLTAIPLKLESTWREVWEHPSRQRAVRWPAAPGRATMTAV